MYLIGQSIRNVPIKKCDVTKKLAGLGLPELDERCYDVFLID